MVKSSRTLRPTALHRSSNPGGASESNRSRTTCSLCRLVERACMVLAGMPVTTIVRFRNGAASCSSFAESSGAASHLDESRQAAPDRGLKLGECTGSRMLQEIEALRRDQAADDLAPQHLLKRLDLQVAGSLQQRDEALLVDGAVTLVDKRQHGLDCGGWQVERNGTR
eukprot:scaffold83804_cov63-Phaeocystis_antarctica.AAC.4